MSTRGEFGSATVGGKQYSSTVGTTVTYAGDATYATDTIGNISGISGLSVVSMGNKYAVLGDSILGQGYSQPNNVATVYPLSAPNNNIGFAAIGCINWASALLGGSLNPVFFGGNSGETSITILARANAITSVGANWLFEMCGTNDVQQISTVYNNNATLCENTLVANRQAIWNIAISAGIKVVAMSTIPCQPSQAWTAAQINVLNRANRRLKAIADASSSVIWVDTAAQMVDPTNASGYGNATYYLDGLHPGNLGAYRMGLAIKNALSPYVKPYSGLISSAVDCIQSDSTSNQLLTGTSALFTSGTSAAAGTGMSGTQVTAWSIYGRTAGTGTAVASVVADSDGIGNAQRTVVTSAASGDSFRLIIGAAVNISQLPAGANFYSECKVIVSGATNLRAVHLENRVDTNGTPATVENDGLNENPITGTGSASYTLVLRSPITQVPTNATVINALRCGIVMTFDGAGGATVDLSRVGIYRVS